MEQTNNEQILERMYKTPSYIRKAVKLYTDKKKTENPEQYKQKRQEANKKYYNKIKITLGDNKEKF